MPVKEFKPRKDNFRYLKKEVRHEAKMISQLEDHCGISLLFGIVTKSKPLQLTKFHGQRDKSLTLHGAIKKQTLDKPSWFGILKNNVKAKRCAGRKY